MPGEINVGLMGLGVVGGGVAAALLGRPEELTKTIGLPMNLKRILVRDPDKPRESNIPADLLTTNPEEILTDQSIHVVVEVMGGSQPAARYIKDALSAGKHVVTANKEVMARQGPELMSLAQGNGVNLLFEASVGGGIPIVGCLMKELLANEVQSIRGIINGTTNYILTRMANHFTDFHQALAEAQDRGFAEADPTNDIDGMDAAYKLAILASLAYHQQVRPEDVYRQGIGSLEAKDFRYAQELGYAIKSLAIATRDNGAIRARVYPSLVPLDNMLAKVDGAYNAVEVDGDLCGKVLFHGLGAGREPTTSAVVGDLIEIGRKLGTGGRPAPVTQLDGKDRILPIDDMESRYYLRLNAADQAGVLAEIARILGEGNISIASVLQKDTDQAAQTAELVITTHPAREASVREALRLVSNLEVVREVNNLLRIED
ncbi:MAG: hypothetical protein BZY88_08020 [SAR202 cluster bacterium Io17-Chloro-G9]|nr:MAG: hypothetical protein BZY88_08020 [SAR202 cluster bacterium Io17-Chloro-G9]